MSKSAKSTKKGAKKNLGRPKKYQNRKERYAAYNKKKPVIRVSPVEKKIIDALRSRSHLIPEIKKKLGVID